MLNFLLHKMHFRIGNYRFCYEFLSVRSKISPLQRELKHKLNVYDTFTILASVSSVQTTTKKTIRKLSVFCSLMYLRFTIQFSFWPLQTSCRPARMNTSLQVHKPPPLPDLSSVMFRNWACAESQLLKHILQATAAHLCFWLIHLYGFSSS